MEDIKRFLKRFENGEEKYNNSALFRNTVNSLLLGNENVYKVIDNLIKITENTMENYKNSPKSPKISYIVKGEAAENLLKSMEANKSKKEKFDKEWDNYLKIIEKKNKKK